VIVFLAGYPALTPQNFDRVFNNCPGRLLSMHPSYLRESGRWLRAMRGFDCSSMELLFDSGAFTAWNTGKPALPADALRRRYGQMARWCDGQGFKNAWFISLDVIPGEPLRVPTQDEIRQAIEWSSHNHAILTADLGDKVLPVFHQDEPLERLHEILNINTHYICISPQNQLLEEWRWQWARNVHALLKDKPILTHGLGATGGLMMELVPWRSVDSRSWLMTAAYGNIIVDVAGRRVTVPISRDNPVRHRFDALPTSVNGPQALTYIEETCALLGFSGEALRDDVEVRCVFNAHSLRQWAARPHQA
jgi:hypothetical protein